ncbi:ROK family protein [Sphingomonas sp. PAMC 26617]|uniref:ROK family protein n=1 Tax=Sphingomonas sp. PAMC 26617 TaxID=1112216 RepID=UPI0002881E20|nr:ROK family protein [Sphingomonas sp. PAMC 26617]
MMHVGVDFGGTKIEAAVLDEKGGFLSRVRTPNPGDYDRAIRDVCAVIARAEVEAGGNGERLLGTVGIGVPGSISPRSGLMQNANSTYLNGRPFREDLQIALGRDVRMANDANCLALSETVDGAAIGAKSAVGVILGTGVGGGVVIDGRIVEGANGIGGEFGHVPLPWLTADEHPGPLCWCGKHGCLEAWISGTGFARAHEANSGQKIQAAAIVAASRSGDPAANESLERYVDQLGRTLALIVNIIDPDVFVLGGGMSNVDELYRRLPTVVRQYVFGGAWEGSIVPARWGDSSGVRGAARL